MLLGYRRGIYRLGTPGSPNFFRESLSIPGDTLPVELTCNRKLKTALVANLSRRFWAYTSNDGDGFAVDCNNMR
ncbi:hypothetical protein, partial [Leptospira noguchii]|uniref:hypothetical protein n=1 Tax=Leptospira noguchii TaxID=28182 RepID=UPI001C6713EC